MISVAHVKQLFIYCQAMLAKHGGPDGPAGHEFYRGKGPRIWENQRPVGCDRHAQVFMRFNIIPNYCFSCYKVLIEPKNVLELFKLMMVLEKLELPNDNSRKCMVETREIASGYYKGFIYCRSIDEGNEVLDLLRKVISREITENMQLTLKRGCSEYALSYPEFPKVGKDSATMEYKEEWQECEDIFDKEYVARMHCSEGGTFNRPNYTLQDANVMLQWIKYAATNGDMSYLAITGHVIPPSEDMMRRV